MEKSIDLFRFFRVAPGGSVYYRLSPGAYLSIAKGCPLEVISSSFKFNFECLYLTEEEIVKLKSQLINSQNRALNAGSI